MQQSYIKNSLLGVSASLLLLGCSGSDEQSCGPVSGGLNGCSTVGTGDGNDSLTSEENSFAFDFTSASFNDQGTVDDSDDILTLVGGDFDGNNAYVRDPGNDRGNLLAFTNDFQEQGVIYYATYGESTSGALVGYLNATGDYVGSGDYIAAYSRNGGSNMPATGNANFTGGYAGAIVNTEGGGVALVEGDATLQVEFGENQKVTGLIENRSVTQADALYGFVPTLADTLVLNESNMTTGGIFTEGTVTAYDAGGTVLGDGDYKGAVGGPNASEAVGAVDVTINDEQELGIFVADCVAGNPSLICDP
ncbi:hypothetical protein GCM10007939_03780 [Amylibacter marinus]|uniref:Transferrin-binding protein B C-lobe/N-lobe beta barrel domain-containing protein n=1 Tax=Amylibacter marinus TaxID=1475483 RepID=A0ABQ5VRY3_9RHOB|nr:hypothetical protein [Amylibacter marinus]GLQ34095.1 hypothetical protein GCM10007939_03780 [Amylibacter marinus]